LRAYCLWLNKGIDTLQLYCAYDKNATSMGLFATQFPTLNADSSFDQAAALPLQAIRSLTHEFAESVPLAQTRPLDFDVIALGPQEEDFRGERIAAFALAAETFRFAPFQSTRTSSSSLSIR